jgi:BTB/POZ domain
MSAIVTISVGAAQRLFAAHEDVLAHSPFLAALCQGQFYEPAKRIELPDESPEIFSCVLEFLYKGDYFPRLEYDKRRRSYTLEDAGDAAPRAAVDVEVLSAEGEPVRVLKDSVIYVSVFPPTNPLSPRSTASPSPTIPPANAIHIANADDTVCRAQVRPGAAADPSAAQAGPAKRSDVRNDPSIGALCVRAHAGHGLAPASALPRAHRAQPCHLQALRHHAGRDGARWPHVLRPLRCYG